MRHLILGDAKGFLTMFIRMKVRKSRTGYWNSPSATARWLNMTKEVAVGSWSAIQTIVLRKMPITEKREYALSLQKNTTQSHKLQNDQGKTMIAKDSFVPLL